MPSITVLAIWSLVINPRKPEPTKLCSRQGTLAEQREKSTVEALVAREAFNMKAIASAVAMILARRQQKWRQRSVLVGVTSIDGSGKAYVKGRIATQLREQSFRVAVIS